MAKRPLETMRLNATVECPGCQTHVNPFVINQSELVGSAEFGVECPTCSHKFRLVRTSARQHTYVVVRHAA